MKLKGPSPIIPSPNAPAVILPSIENTYALTNPFASKASIVFSPHKPGLINHSTVSLTIPLGDWVYFWCLFQAI